MSAILIRKSTRYDADFKNAMHHRAAHDYVALYYRRNIPSADRDDSTLGDLSYRKDLLFTRLAVLA